jgi:hypothetical protein
MNSLVNDPFRLMARRRPRQDSNLRSRLRRAAKSVVAGRNAQLCLQSSPLTDPRSAPVNRISLHEPLHDRRGGLGGLVESAAGARPPCSPIWHRHRRVGRRVDRSYPSSDGLGNSEGLRPSGWRLQSSAGMSGTTWSARLANSERSTSPSVLAAQGKSRGCSPLREFYPIRSQAVRSTCLQVTGDTPVAVGRCPEIPYP